MRALLRGRARAPFFAALMFLQLGAFCGVTPPEEEEEPETGVELGFLDSAVRPPPGGFESSVFLIDSSDPVQAFDVTFQYDPAIATIDFALTPDFDDDGAFFRVEHQPGSARVVDLRHGDAALDGSIAAFVVLVEGEAEGNTDLEVSGEIARADGSLIPVTSTVPLKIRVRP